MPVENGYGLFHEAKIAEVEIRKQQDVEPDSTVRTIGCERRVKRITATGTPVFIEDSARTPESIQNR